MHQYQGIIFCGLAAGVLFTIISSFFHQGPTSNSSQPAVEVSPKLALNKTAPPDPPIDCLDSSIQETQRRSLITGLAQQMDVLVKAGDSSEAFKIDAQIMRRPAPENVDLSAALIGTWRSPRHDYIYRADGTWSMLPADPGTTHGQWTVSGNKIFESVGDSPFSGNPTGMVIILLNKEQFIFTDGKTVFYEKRIN